MRVESFVSQPARRLLNRGGRIPHIAVRAEEAEMWRASHTVMSWCSRACGRCGVACRSVSQGPRVHGCTRRRRLRIAVADRRRSVTVTRSRKGRRYATMLGTSSTPLTEPVERKDSCHEQSGLRL